MNTLLDPFYGVTRVQQFFARLFNRLILLAEIAAFGILIYMHIITPYFGNWIYVLAPVAFLVAIGVINTILRGFWNIIMVIRFGTSDPDEIVDSLRAKSERKTKKYGPQITWKTDQEILADHKALIEKQKNDKLLMNTAAKTPIPPPVKREKTRTIESSLVGQKT